MRRAQHNQRDLFDQATRVRELPPDLRTKLTPLVQVLLTEAAAAGPRQAKADDLGEEDGDDQDHA